MGCEPGSRYSIERCYACFSVASKLKPLLQIGSTHGFRPIFHFMKEILALLWAICITVVAIYLHATNKISRSSAGIFFAVAIVGGLTIANYDFVRRFEAFGVKVETARQEISIAKNQALAEIEKEVESHKQTIAMLVRSGNQLSTRLEDQKTVVNKMIEKAQSLENQIQVDQKKLEEVKTQVDVANQNSQTIYTATKELSLILTRITYVQASTKSEFGGGPRLEKATAIINQDINRVLNLMIPNLQERAHFIEELQSSLPAR